MARYHNVHAKIHQDPVFLDYSPEAKLLFFYLLTSENKNVSGVFSFPLKLVSFSCGLTPQQVKAALEEITNSQKALYDWENQVVWVKNAFKYEPKTPNAFKALRNDYLTVKTGLWEEFKKQYPQALLEREAGEEEPIGNPYPTIEEPLGNYCSTIGEPIGNPCPTLEEPIGNPCPTLEEPLGNPCLTLREPSLPIRSEPIPSSSEPDLSAKLAPGGLTPRAATGALFSRGGGEREKVPVPPKPKPVKPADPRVKQALDYYSERYSEIFGFAADVRHGRDEKIIKDRLVLLDKENPNDPIGSLETLKGLLKKFLNLEEKFISDNGYALNLFSARFNGLRLNGARRKETEESGMYYFN